MMPGQKDFVSIGRNKHMQKRLFLCNLKELYAQFKQQHPDTAVGFSKFCSLRPKCYTLVGPSGSHFVCVCTIHQNITLLVNSINIDEDVHSLVDMIVCDRTSKECNCSGKEPLKVFLTERFLSNALHCSVLN